MVLVELVILITLLLQRVVFMVSSIFADVSNSRALKEQGSAGLTIYHFINTILREGLCMVGLVVGYFILTAIPPALAMDSLIFVLLKVVFIMLIGSLFRIVYILIMSISQANYMKKQSQSQD